MRKFLNSMRLLILIPIVIFVVVFFAANVGVRWLPCYMDGDEEQRVQAACDYLESGHSVVAMGLNNQNDVDWIMNKIHNDPNLFWLGINYKVAFVGNTGIITVNKKYTDIDALRAQIECVADSIIGDIIASDMSEYDKVLAIHDWICENVEYGYDSNHSDQDIYGALVLRGAVCAGYAKSFTYLLDKVGIESHVISGHAVESGKIGEAHAWNLVYIDDKPYYFDITWDDEGDYASYDWFGVTDDEFATRHKPSRGYEWVDANSTKANYYIRNGVYLESYSAEAIAELIVNQGDNVIIKCANSQVFEDTLAAFKIASERDEIEKMAGLESQISVTYSDNPQTNCIYMQIEANGQISSRFGL